MRLKWISFSRAIATPKGNDPESKRVDLTNLPLKTMTPSRHKRLPLRFWKADSAVSRNNWGRQCESFAGRLLATHLSKLVANSGRLSKASLTTFLSLSLPCSGITHAPLHCAFLKQQRGLESCENVMLSAFAFEPIDRGNV